ncbi:hypothetical protein QYZ87_10830 [Porphyromonadaceae bacterium W3.11]|nr:hypothetical protein [Porphyromonadaceae bacterium W3.11]
MNTFSLEELNSLDLIEIKGGMGSADYETIQNQCPNEVAGCACTIKIERGTQTQN